MATQASLAERFFSVVSTKTQEATPLATEVLDIRSRRKMRRSAGPERLAQTQHLAWPQNMGQPIAADYHERINTPLDMGLVAQVSRRIGMELQFGDKVEIFAEKRWCPVIITGFYGPCDGVTYLDPDASGVTVCYAPANVWGPGQVCLRLARLACRRTMPSRPLLLL